MRKLQRSYERYVSTDPFGSAEHTLGTNRLIYADLHTVIRHEPRINSPNSYTAFMLSARLAIQYRAENAEEAYLTLLRGPNVSSAMTSLTEPLRESRRSNFRSACWPASSVWLLALMKDLEVAMLSGLESEWHAALLVLKLHCLFNLVPSSPTILFLWFLYRTTGRNNVVEFSGSMKSVTSKSIVSVDLIMDIIPF